MVACLRNQSKIFGRKPVSYMECQPQDNPGYVRNEKKYPKSYEAKTPNFSGLCGAITGFGTQGSQVRILPLRPIFQLLKPTADFSNPRLIQRFLIDLNK
jgi:hypothetical protein